MVAWGRPWKSGGSGGIMMILILPSSRPCPGPPTRRGIICLAGRAGRAAGAGPRWQIALFATASAPVQTPLGRTAPALLQPGLGRTTAPRERALPMLLSSAMPQGTRYRYPRP
jgi:hypothetical protein